MALDAQSDRGDTEPRPTRRRALGAGVAGVVAIGLPGAADAASPVGGAEPQIAAAPATVSATPIGYLGSSTGAIRVSWAAVTGATTYRIGYSTMSVNGPYDTIVNTTDSATSFNLTGLVGTDTVHHLVVWGNVSGTLSQQSTPVSSSSVIATGGAVTTFVGDGTIGVNGTRYVVHSFTSTGSANFTLNRDMDIEHLIVAGGGSGGSRHGGGGGAGGLLTNVGAATARAASGTPYSIVVGAGGAGAAQHNNSFFASNPNFSGDNSSAFGLTAVGGGRGGGASGGQGGSGGSGGGTAQVEFSGGAGTSGQGNGGGRGVSNPWAGGGGGGAGGAGSNATQVSGTANGGAGGAGAANTITGSSVVYAGGGGGSGHPSAGSGGSGGSGGGGAGTTNGAGTNAAANTGGGGGAGGYDGANINYAGGNGGSGVVIIRYAIPA